MFFLNFYATIKDSNQKNIFLNFCRVENSCVLHLLFLIETTANENLIRDVNFCPALSRLYRDKVVHHVGGLTSYSTFVRQNPNWEEIVIRFEFESLLDDFKNGRLMAISTLDATRADVSAIEINSKNIFLKLYLMIKIDICIFYYFLFIDD